MGYYRKQIRITGVRSAHNSMQDRLDDAKWNYLADRIRRLIEQDDYESLQLDMEGPTEE